MDHVTVSFGVRDVVMIVGFGITMAGIGITIGVLREEFRHMKATVGRVEKLVTNGLSHKVDEIDRKVDALPCSHDNRCKLEEESA